MSNKFFRNLMALHICTAVDNDSGIHTVTFIASLTTATFTDAVFVYDKAAMLRDTIKEILRTSPWCCIETVTKQRNSGGHISLLLNTAGNFCHATPQQPNEMSPFAGLIAVVTWCFTLLTIRELRLLPTQDVHVFCVDLRTNSDYFPIQH
jgi:hypothetical protein